jgi:hypothetical protein
MDGTLLMLTPAVYRPALQRITPCLLAGFTSYFTSYLTSFLTSTLTSYYFMTFFLLESLNLVECLIEVGNDVVDMFHTD